MLTGIQHPGAILPSSFTNATARDATELSLGNFAAVLLLVVHFRVF